MTIEVREPRDDGTVTGETVTTVLAADQVSPGLVLRWSAAGTLGVLGVLLAAYAIYLVRGILVLVFIALFLAVSLEPAVRWLTARGVRRSAAVTIVMAVLVGMVAAFVWSVVPPLVDQAGKLVSDLPGYLHKLSTQSRAVREVTDRYHLTDKLNELLAAAPGRLAGGAVGFVQRFFGFVGSTLTVLVLTIYFMADIPRLRRGVVLLFPSRRRTRVGEIVDVAVEKVGGYMIGNIIISLIAGAATFACLEALRVPFALPLAVTVAITDLIPMIGATLGAVVCVTVAVLTGGVWPDGVLVLAFFLLYQQVENYLIAPRVLRGTVNLSSVGVLLVALVGGTVLGLIGAVIAIPIAATVKVAVSPVFAAGAGARNAGAGAQDAGDRPPTPDDRSPTGSDRPTG
jgi:predicted PurR-regulated permease PerM